MRNKLVVVMLATLVCLCACDDERERTVDPKVEAWGQQWGAQQTGAPSGLPPGHPDLGVASSSQPAAQSMPAAAGARQPHPGGLVPAAAVGEIDVARAEGSDGRTVAEVHAQIAALDGKPVAVRGKVVKFNAGIMGKNWLHLRDGSGSREQGDDDLTVTTQGVAAVGDEVVIRGTARRDRDFGAGYLYRVIVEDAAVDR